MPPAPSRRTKPPSPLPAAFRCADGSIPQEPLPDLVLENTGRWDVNTRISPALAAALEAAPALPMDATDPTLVKLRDALEKLDRGESECCGLLAGGWCACHPAAARSCPLAQQPAIACCCWLHGLLLHPLAAPVLRSLPCCLPRARASCPHHAAPRRRCAQACRRRRGRSLVNVCRHPGGPACHRRRPAAGGRGNRPLFPVSYFSFLFWRS